MSGIPIKFKYEEFTKEGKKGTKLGYSYKVWFTFLGMDENNDDFFSGSKGKNTWFEHLDKNTLKEYGPEYENLIKNANTEPHRAITIRHEATSKTHVKLNNSTAHDKKEKKSTSNGLSSRQEKQMFNLLISRCNIIFIEIKSDR